MSKYDPLRRYLQKIPAEHTEVRLTFHDLERMSGPLPASAHNHRPWWANDATHSQSAAWQQAGFRVQQVNLTAGPVVFARVRPHPRPAEALATRSTSDPPHPRAISHTATVGDDHTEVAVQARLVAYLAGQQWQLQRVADTASREQGIDILATKNGRTLAIEVMDTRAAPTPTRVAQDRSGRPTRLYKPATGTRRPC